MTFLEEVKYSDFEQTYRTPGWVKSERYEYCDGFYEKAGEEKGLFVRLATALRSVF